MDSPTIKTDNFYSFSPLVDQVFETVIAMWRLQPDHISEIILVYFAFKSMFVSLRIKKGSVALSSGWLHISLIQISIIPAVQTIKVLNFLSGQISEKTFHTLVLKSTILLLSHTTDKSYFKKKKT